VAEVPAESAPSVTGSSDVMRPPLLISLVLPEGR
jgi:hypothetical protein